MHAVASLPENLLVQYGFNYSEPSLRVTTKTGRHGTAYCGEYKNSQILVIEMADGKRETYFGTIADMRSDEITGSRHAEFMDSLLKIITKKNRIAGKDLAAKLEEVGSEDARRHLQAAGAGTP